MRLPSLRLLAAIALVSGAAAIYALRAFDRPVSVSRDGVAMDTFVSVTLWSSDGGPDESALKGVMDEIFAKLHQLDEHLSMKDRSSPLAHLNSSRKGEAVRVPQDLFSAIESAVDMATITGGAYDPTIGAITDLWSCGDDPRIPSDGEIERALRTVGIENIELARPDRITKKIDGTMIDLGGIGKGYASVLISSMLSRAGIESAIISLGGNVIAYGSRPDGSDWTIGVQDPSADRGKPICTIRVSGQSVITAGVYERRWEMDGEVYTHIYDPTTGRPVTGPLVSVTIVSEDPSVGDAISTAFMVLGVDRSLSLMRILPDIEAIFITADGTSRAITATEGLRGSIELMDRSARLTYVSVDTR